MKKIVAFLLLVVMCFALVACGDKDEGEAISAEESAIVGTWETKSFPYGDYIFVFNEDGTGSINKYEIRWKYDAELYSYIICSEGFDQVYSIRGINTDEDGMRYFEYEGYKCYYKVD